jgi:hypothetical protein
MALTLLNNIGARLWVKNPIILSFLAAGIPSSTYIIITIDSGGDTIATLRYPILNWLVKVPIEDIVRAIFNEPQFPPELKFSGDWIAEPQSNDRVRTIFVKYRLSTDGPESEVYVSRKVIDGGIASLLQKNIAEINQYESYNPSLFFGKNGRFVTHIPSGRKVDAALNGWIPYYHDTGLVPEIEYIVTYLSGDTTSVYQSWPARADYTDTFWQIPFGIDQCELDLTGLGVRKVELKITAYAPLIDETLTLGSYIVNFDYRASYNWVDIGFKNSLGGWDMLRMNGEMEWGTEAVKKEYEQSQMSVLGSNPYFDSEIRPRWVVNTGYISGQEMAAMNDLLNSVDIRILFEEKWLPIRCKNKSIGWKDTKNNLFNEQFEFEFAGDFNTLPIEIMSLFAKHPELR